MYTSLYQKGKNLYTQNLINLLYTTQRLAGTYVDVAMFQKFIDETYTPVQAGIYFFFRKIFQEVTKIDLFEYGRLRTDPTKLILTKEVCEEMLAVGFSENEPLRNKLNQIKNDHFLDQGCGKKK